MNKPDFIEEDKQWIDAIDTSKIKLENTMSKEEYIEITYNENIIRMKETEYEALRNFIK